MRGLKYCQQCGAGIERRVPAGDDRPRAVCTACATVHYENPRTVVGCVVEEGSRLLLCRRAIEPAHGLWTVPAGFLELGESFVEGALRETREEALAAVEVIAPHSLLDLPHIGQHYALFRARLRSGFGAGAESLETRLFSLDELPWDELAFPVIHFALRLYVTDRAAGRHRMHLGIVRFNGSGPRFQASSYELQGHLAVPVEGA